MVFVEDCLINTYWLGYYRIHYMFEYDGYSFLRNSDGIWPLRHAKTSLVEWKIYKGPNRRVLNGVFYIIFFL